MSDEAPAAAADNADTSHDPDSITLVIPTARVALGGLVLAVALATSLTIALLRGGERAATADTMSPTTAAAPATAAPDEGATLSPGLAEPGNAVLPNAPPDIQSAGWKMTFNDEFDGTTLDTNRWMDAYPGGTRTHSNNEQQYYAPDGWSVNGGLLRLTAEKRETGGMPYKSGMVSSYGQFAQKYGWFEIRTRVPRGKGYWPAFWLLPNSRSWPPEIDIVEIVGDKPNQVLLSHHYGTSYRDHAWRTEKFNGPDFGADFHTFAVDWQPDHIAWYVDGVERHRVTDHVPQEPMYVLANLAIGGDLPGMPDETTKFPGTMEVDYIRVFQKPGQ